MASAQSTEIVDALFARYTMVGGIVGALVLGYLLFAAVWHSRHGRDREPADAPRAGITSPQRGRPWVIWAMIVSIALILFPLAIGTQSGHEHLESPHDEPGLVLEVVGFRYGWTVRYPGGFEGLNEVRMPAGVLVRLDVSSMDVMHKFHVADYRTGVDAMPGKVNHLYLTVDEPGTLSVVHCAELCGPGHALMKAQIVVMDPLDFQEWLVAQQAPADGAPPQLLEAVIDRTGVVLDTDRLMAQIPVTLRVRNNGDRTSALQLDGPWTNLTAPLEPGSEIELRLDPVTSAGTLTLQLLDAGNQSVGDQATVPVIQPAKASVSLQEFKLVFDAKRFPAGSPVLLSVANEGAIPHDLHLTIAGVEAAATPVLTGSGAAFLPFWMPTEGSVEAWCALPGHADGGMRETLEATP